MKILQACEKDAQTIALLYAALLDDIVTGGNGHYPVEEMLVARLKSIILHKRYSIFLAEKNGKTVGFVACTERSDAQSAKKYGSVLALYVLPDCRRYGLGKALIDRVKELGRKRGWQRLSSTLAPVKNQQDLLSFYEKAGFVPGSCQEVMYGIEPAQLLQDNTACLSFHFSR